MKMLPLTPFASAVMAAVVWSVSPILEKHVLGRADPMACLVIRTAGALLGGALLWPFAGDVRTAFGQIGWTGTAMLLAAGALASVGGQVFMYDAMRRADVSLVSPVAASWPLLVLVFGRLFLKEPITGPKALGCALVIGGLWMLRF